MKKVEKSIMHSKHAQVSLLVALNLLLVAGFCAAHKIYEKKELNQSSQLVDCFEQVLGARNLEVTGLGSKASNEVQTDKKPDDPKKPTEAPISKTSKKVKEETVNTQERKGKDVPVSPSPPSITTPKILSTFITKVQKALGIKSKKDSTHKNIVKSKSKIKDEARPKKGSTISPTSTTKLKSKPKSAPMKFLARITVYWAKGGGTDKWSAKNISSTGTKLQCGVHAAVDPKVIPYGSKVKLTKGNKEVLVKAVDTGSHVKKRKAAIAMGRTPLEKKAPVVDLFFQNKSDALTYAKNNPHFQWVKVYPPEVSM